MAKLYQITGWEKDETGIEFLEMIARKRGKLLKGGEPDVHSVSKSVLRDWQYGKIPYLTQPDPNYVTKVGARLLRCLNYFKFVGKDQGKRAARDRSGQKTARGNFYEAKGVRKETQN